MIPPKRKWPCSKTGIMFILVQILIATIKISIEIGKYKQPGVPSYRNAILADDKLIQFTPTKEKKNKIFILSMYILKK